MAGSSLFGNLARAAQVIALLLFFLPWVAVSCSPDAMERIQRAEGGSPSPASAPAPVLNAGVKIATASGLNMALGTVSLSLPGGGLDPGGGSAKQSGPPPQVPIEIGVIVGAALIVLSLLATFLMKGLAGAVAGIGGSLLAIAAFCYSVFISYPPSVVAALAANNGRGGGEGSNLGAEQLAQILSVKVEAAFYFVLIMLALAIVFNVLAMKKAAAPSVAVAPPVPPADPPAAV